MYSTKFLSKLDFFNKSNLLPQEAISQNYPITNDFFLNMRSTTTHQIPSSDISTEQLKSIVQSVDTGIIAQSPQGNLIYGNSSAAHLLGFETTEQLFSYYKKTGAFFNQEKFLATDSLGNKLNSDDLSFYAISLEKDHAQTVVNLLDKHSNQLTRLDIKSQLIQAPQQEENMIISMITDVSSLAQLEKQKDEFMSMASHELKTPITSIKVFTQVLERVFQKKGDTDAIYYLGKIESQLNKLTMLVKELLDVSRMQTGRLELHKEVFPLDELVVEICEQMQYTTDRHTIRPDILQKGNVSADKERIGQVLVNLLANAIKYSPSNVSITVVCDIDGNDMIVRVIDEGIGIGKDDLDHIFDRFAKVRGKEESTFPGMGVGLYIASQIIKRHSGKMQVKSTLQKGSTFTFTLPETHEA